MYYLFCYDVENDKSRTAIMKYLKDRGYHLQKSVFVADCQNQQEANSIYDHLKSTVDQEKDSVFMTSICQKCLKRMLHNHDNSFETDVWIV